MVNIIIPIYKSLETLPKALDSLVAQTKEMFIVTLVNDCDNLDYSQIIEDYTARGLKIRYLVQEKNGGPGLARQRGMDEDLMCDYFMFMDSDDILYPRAIQMLYREAKLKNADIVISNFIAEQDGAPGILMSNQGPVTWMHGKIYKASYLRKHNIRFLEELSLNEDAYFNLVAINCTDNKYRIDEITYLWRDNKNSLTRLNDAKTTFANGWKGYIYSQVRGLQDIYDRRGSLPAEVTAATLINIYNHCMLAIHYEEDLESVEELLQSLNTNTGIAEAMKNINFWQTISQLAKQSQFIDDENLLFYKMRFNDWLDRYIKIRH